MREELRQQVTLLEVAGAEQILMREVDQNVHKEVLDKMNMMTFYGVIKFDDSPKAHGLQVGHDMVYIQWQKGKDGKPAKQVVWPEVAATASAMVCPSR